MAFYARPEDLFDQRLTQNGDGTGNDNANGNYSPGSPGVFSVNPQPSQVLEIFSFQFTLVCATEFGATDYGDGSSLVNGITVTIEDNSGVIHDMLGGQIITTNAGWQAFIDVDTIIERRLSTAAYTGEAVFLATYGRPIRLFGDLGHKFVITYKDDMTSRLTDQVASVAGVVVDN